MAIKNPPPPSAPRHDYDDVAFRTDHSGGAIAIRPRQFIASVTDLAKLRDALVAIAIDVFAPSRAKAARAARAAPTKRQNPFTLPGVVADLGAVRGSYRLFELDRRFDIDVIRLVRGLREHGVPAQPNHVYFASTVTAAAPGTSRVAPNMFTPNMFTPNMFTPNMFTPNMFTGGAGGGGGGGCCCRDGLATGEVSDDEVPPLAARPAPKLGRPAWLAKRITRKDAKVQVHVVDILSLGANGGTKTLVGEYNPQQPPQPPAQINSNGDAWADPAMGHGDFITSIIKLRSGLDATLWQAADPLGAIDDRELVDALEQVQSRASALPARRVLNLSLAGYNEDDRPSTVLADQIEAMIEAGWLIVAAAGNSASCRLAWPAALPGVVAVGALGTCAPAWFSNFGPWLDVSAPGVDIVAEYAPLTNAGDGLGDLLVGVDHDPRAGTCEVVRLKDFTTGWAKWSGTSFAAPFVAARLALALHAQAPSARSGAGRAAALQAANRRAMTSVFDNDTTDWHPYYGRLIQ